MYLVRVLYRTNPVSLYRSFFRNRLDPWRQDSPLHVSKSVARDRHQHRRRPGDAACASGTMGAVGMPKRVRRERSGELKFGFLPTPINILTPQHERASRAALQATDVTGMTTDRHSHPRPSLTRRFQWANIHIYMLDGPSLRGTGTRRIKSILEICALARSLRHA